MLQFRPVGASLRQAALHQDVPVDLAGAIESLKQQLAVTEESLERAQEWQDSRTILQEQLRDCAGVSSATSLVTIEPKNVTALLGHSLVNPDWETLRPLLFRLWGERFAWTNPEAVTIAAMLERALGSARVKWRSRSTRGTTVVLTTGHSPRSS